MSVTTQLGQALNHGGQGGHGADRPAGRHNFMHTSVSPVTAVVDLLLTSRSQPRKIQCIAHFKQDRLAGSRCTPKTCLCTPGSWLGAARSRLGPPRSILFRPVRNCAEVAPARSRRNSARSAPQHIASARTLAFAKREASTAVPARSFDRLELSWIAERDEFPRPLPSISSSTISIPSRAPPRSGPCIAGSDQRTTRSAIITLGPTNRSPGRAVRR